MTIRTSKTSVTFRRPFVLEGLEQALPAGVYELETDEALLVELSFPAYRRISSRLQLHAEPGRSGAFRTLVIDPEELDAALKRDQADAEQRVEQDRCPCGAME